jgi:hypothetical protein
LVLLRLGIDIVGFVFKDCCRHSDYATLGAALLIAATAAMTATSFHVLIMILTPA